MVMFWRSAAPNFCSQVCEHDLRESCAAEGGDTEQAVAAKEEDPMFGSKESWPTTAGFREEIPMNRFGMSMSGWRVEDLKSRCVE